MSTSKFRHLSHTLPTHIGAVDGVRRSNEADRPVSFTFVRRISLVIDTLTEASKADPDRKCFRLIGGVLVERTVKEVLPALQTNLEGVSIDVPPPLASPS